MTSLTIYVNYMVSQQEITLSPKYEAENIEHYVFYMSVISLNI